MKEIRCIRCDRPFKAKLYRIRDGTAKYCSYKCKWGPRVEYNCIRCGKQCTIKPSHFGKGGRGRYCSNRCKWGQSIEYKCVRCNKLAKIRPSHFGVRGGGTYCSRMCKFLTSSNTYIEKKIRGVLDELMIKYNEQFEIRISGKRFIMFDFAIIDKKVAIECDGEYWHNSDRGKIYDARKNKWCLDNGWKLLRLAERDIEKNIELCRDNIIRVL